MIYKLGANGVLPDVPNADYVKATIPELLDVSNQVIAKGKRLYGNSCMACHGDQAYSSGLVPNLRFSKITTNKQAWNTIVAGGALAQQGMPCLAATAQRLRRVTKYHTQNSF